MREKLSTICNNNQNQKITKKTKTKQKQNQKNPKNLKNLKKTPKPKTKTKNIEKETKTQEQKKLRCRDLGHLYSLYAYIILGHLVLSGEGYVSRGAAEGAEFLKSGGGMSFIWQCGLVSLFSLEDSFSSVNHI